MESKTRQLRRLIESKEILIMPGVFDGYSMRLTEKAGYSAAFITGGGLSESRLGWADMGVMSYEDKLSACRQIVGCSDLPLIATEIPVMATPSTCTSRSKGSSGRVSAAS